MRFLSIVKSAENQGAPPQALLEAIGKLTEASLKDGSVVSTGGLGTSGTGFRMRIAKGKVTTTDGPFTEAKEVIGGFAIIEAASKREAIETTRRFLEFHHEHWPTWEGECEVRELVFLAP
ncbi:MAG TPA: YciI family protein [Gemmatimonadales bacterium]|nr:YciI family protein [Gemmatimonadales bacterium]